jgi:hypothetical protein
MRLSVNDWLGNNWCGRFGACIGAVLKLAVRFVLVFVLGLYLASNGLGLRAKAQGVSTTTVQGTVYLANGQVGSGTLHLSWPAFSTAAGLSIAADSLDLAIASDGFVSVNLAPNLGATPAGLYYTAVYHMSDGSTSTQYSEFSTALFINLPLGS